MAEYANYIDGEWVPGINWQSNINPSDTTDIIGQYAQADAAQAAAAVDAARRAYPAWAAGTPQKRFDCLGP